MASGRAGKGERTGERLGYRSGTIRALAVGMSASPFLPSWERPTTSQAVAQLLAAGTINVLGVGVGKLGIFEVRQA